MTFTPFRTQHLLQSITSYEKQHLPLDVFLKQYFRQHHAIGSKDRALIAQTAYDMVRWRGLIDHFCDKPVSWEKRLAQYVQLQSVNFEVPQQNIPPHVLVSFPQELFQELETYYGLEQAMQFCRVSNMSAPTTIRVNLLKISRQELFDRLQKQQYSVSYCTQSDEGITFAKKENFAAMSEFKEGLFEVQDESSQLVARCVKVAKGQHVLDYCAGAGGKALAIGMHMGNTGQLYLHDIRPYALEQARERLRRAGVQNMQILAPKHSNLSKLKHKANWVLVDAPCSGTGTLRRNPDMKWNFSLTMVHDLQVQQRQIFAEALQYLHPEGKIIYVTCSVLPQENLQQVEYFKQKHDLKLEASLLQILPSQNGGDGFFAATFTR